MLPTKVYEKMAEQLEQTTKSLDRIQKFDASTLVRDDDLGAHLNFEDAVEPARRIISVAQRLPTAILSDLVDGQLKQIETHCNNVYNIFEQCLKFSPEDANPKQARDGLISQIKSQYDSFFTTLFPFIAYGVSQKTDFDRVDRESRAVLQGINDRAEELRESLESHEGEAARILEDVKKTASEQGVTQQAIYFKDAATDHGIEAGKWKKYTIFTSIGLGAYAFLSIFLHKIEFFRPENNYETIQLVTSKVLIFGVIAYMLILCARNFLSHTHNQIVNKHRQNALLTFEALTDAVTADAARDVVLTHAASCIFNPQDTGYTRSNAGQPQTGFSVVDLANRFPSKLDDNP